MDLSDVGLFYRTCLFYQSGAKIEKNTRFILLSYYISIVNEKKKIYKKQENKELRKNKYHKGKRKNNITVRCCHKICRECCLPLCRCKKKNIKEKWIFYCFFFLVSLTSSGLIKNMHSWKLVKVCPH